MAGSLRRSHRRFTLERVQRPDRTPEVSDVTSARNPTRVEVWGDSFLLTPRDASGGP